MITPIVWPITIFSGDDFDLQLNWRERCGATFSLSDYNARFNLWPSKTDRSSAIYTLTSPFVAGEGIQLADTSPNIWLHILEANTSGFDPVPLWYILELQTPTGPNPEIDGVWFRLVEAPVTYRV